MCQWTESYPYTPTYAVCLPAVLDKERHLTFVQFLTTPPPPLPLYTSGSVRVIWITQLLNVEFASFFHLFIFYVTVENIMHFTEQG
jgi:hypothetical protein